jgi:hypothetical protein
LRKSAYDSIFTCRSVDVKGLKDALEEDLGSEPKSHPLGFDWIISHPLVFEDDEGDVSAPSEVLLNSAQSDNLHSSASCEVRALPEGVEADEASEANPKPETCYIFELRPNVYWVSW